MNDMREELEGVFENLERCTRNIGANHEAQYFKRYIEQGRAILATPEEPRGDAVAYLACFNESLVFAEKGAKGAFPVYTRSPEEKGLLIQAFQFIQQVVENGSKPDELWIDAAKDWLVSVRSLQRQEKGSVFSLQRYGDTTLVSGCGEVLCGECRGMGEIMRDMGDSGPIKGECPRCEGTGVERCKYSCKEEMPNSSSNRNQRSQAMSKEQRVELRACPLCSSSHAVTVKEDEAFCTLLLAARHVAYGYPDELPDRSFDVDYAEMMALRAALVPFAEVTKAEPDCPWCIRDGKKPRKLELQWVCEHCGYRGDPDAEPTLVEKEPDLEAHIVPEADARTVATNYVQPKYVCEDCGRSIMTPFNGGHLVETSHPTWCGPVREVKV